MTTSPALRWPRRLPPWAADLAVALAVAVAMTLTISVASEEDATRAPGLFAYLLGIAVGLFVLVRRRWPMGALLGSVGLLMVYYSAGYPAFSPAVPLAAAAYFAALAGQLVAAGALLTGLLVLGAGWQTLGEHGSLASVVGTGTLTDAALLAAVLLLGEAVRSRRAWAEEVQRRTRRAEQDREREAARRVAAERLRIARELHDVLAHTIAGVNVQAGVAADVIDDAPAQAKASLQAIRGQTRAAMAELNATVGLLRDDGGERGGDGAPRAPAPSLAGLDALVRTAGGAGVAVELAITGGPRPLPGAIELTAYRIVQESLTNVVRHAHATAASVRVHYGEEALLVDVEDDGRGLAGSGDGAAGDGAADDGAAASGGGYGLAGMRERAAAVGGVLAAGPRAGSGFRVHAELPAA